MPSPPAHLWPCHIWFVAVGHKPDRARLPGLDIGPGGRYPNGQRIWRCYFDGLLSN